MRDPRSKPNGLHLRRRWLTLAAVSCLLACDDEPLELTKGDTKVVVPERYRECAVDDDCTLANISCDGCCERDAVAKSLQKAFERDRKDSCSGYDGLECDCAFAELEARCKEERCVAVPVPAE